MPSCALPRVRVNGGAVRSRGACLVGHKATALAGAWPAEGRCEPLRAYPLRAALPLPPVPLARTVHCSATQKRQLDEVRALVNEVFGTE